MKTTSALNKLFLYTIASGLLFLGVCYLFTTLYDQRLLHLVHQLALTVPKAPVQLAPKTMALPGINLSEIQSPLSDISPANPVLVTQAAKRHNHPKASEVFSFKPAVSSKILRNVAQTLGKMRHPYVYFLGKAASSQENKNTLKHSPKTVKAGGYSGQKNSVDSHRIEMISSMLNRPSQRYLFRAFTGRLGNILFQLASAFCIAKLNNLKLVFRDVKQLEDFRYQGVRAIDRHWKWLLRLPFKRHVPRTCCGFDPDVMVMKENISHSLHGYLQSWKYFEFCKSQIKRVILFKDSVIQKAVTIVVYLRTKLRGRTLVGVHVRMGDYLSPGAIANGKKVAPPEFYHRAMTYFRSRFPNVTFVVMTSREDWFKSHVTNASDVMVLGWSDSPAVDMEVVSRMDHVIFSVGTFGWWIAYKNNGTVVCYKDFYVPGSFYGLQIWNNATDFFYPGWVLL